MNAKNLSSYLNNHLAGSVAALELLEQLISHDSAEKVFFVTLRGEIAADQEVLQTLINTLGLRESGMRKAGAWTAEKLTRIRFWLAGAESGELGRLEALEALSLGIEGKLSLWRALAESVGVVPALGTLDFATLEQRAIDQRDRVETLRVQEARKAFKG